MSTTVVNIKTDECDVYIGRKKNVAFHYGNPFSFNAAYGILVKDRAACVQAYDDWLAGKAWQHVEQDRRRWILETIGDLAGKRLGCFCSPQQCHGDVLKRLIDE